jgi:hypothetical protein
VLRYAVMPGTWLTAVKHYEAMSCGKKSVSSRARVRRSELQVIARVVVYRAAGRAGANLLVRWRDVPDKIALFIQPWRQVRLLSRTFKSKL